MALGYIPLYILLIFYLILTMTRYLPHGNFITRSNSSFYKPLNFPKGFTYMAAHILPSGELIIDDTPKGLPLVPSHRSKVITCSSHLNKVQQDYFIYQNNRSN